MLAGYCMMLNHSCLPALLPAPPAAFSSRLAALHTSPFPAQAPALRVLFKGGSCMPPCAYRHWLPSTPLTPHPLCCPLPLHRPQPHTYCPATTLSKPLIKHSPCLTAIHFPPLLVPSLLHTQAPAPCRPFSQQSTPLEPFSMTDRHPVPSLLIPCAVPSPCTEPSLTCIIHRPHLASHSLNSVSA